MKKEELYDICKNIIELHKFRYTILKAEIEHIIMSNIKDERHIERILDEMLDTLMFYETEDTLLSYRKLCRYYFDINPQATIDYINYYKEQNDPEGIKFGNNVSQLN